jgi:hypothetical protein
VVGHWRKAGRTYRSALDEELAQGRAFVVNGLVGTVAAVSFEEDAKILRDHLELIHRLNTTMVEALLQVAEETNTPPGKLAQLVGGMGGGGLHMLFQPLVMRYHEEQQRRFMEAQRASQAPPETG